MVFDRYPTGGGEMLLALALADHAHDDGTHIFPSIALLSQKTRQSERSVQYQLRRMEQTGWLVLVNDGMGGRNRTRQYRISPDWMKGAEIAPFEKGAKQGPKGCKTTQERVQNGVVKGATAIAPEPRATKSNQEQPSLRECDAAGDGSLAEREIEAALAGFGALPAGVDRETLARFTRHRNAIRRPLSIQGWIQVRTSLTALVAAGHDANKSLRDAMAAGLSLPVIPNTGAPTNAAVSQGSAAHVDQLRAEFERNHRGNAGSAGSAGSARPAGDVIDGEFRVVG